MTTKSVAIVTGASQGIGRATARRLAHAAALLEFELCSYVAFGLLKVTNDKKECTCPACLIRSRLET